MTYEIIKKDDIYELRITNADTRWSSIKEEDLVEIVNKCPHKNPVTQEDDFIQYRWILQNKNTRVRISRRFYT